MVERLVSVREGATTLKQTFALVYSDARALAIPSKADLEAPMLAWNGKPIFAATLDINTTLAPSASLSLLITFLTTLDAPRTLILKSLRKSSSFNIVKGFRFIVPGK